MVNKNRNCRSFLNKIVWAILGIVIGIIALMISSNFFNQKEDTQQQTPVEEPLPLPEYQKQGEPEITKLNPDSQLKEGW